MFSLLAFARISLVVEPHRSGGAALLRVAVPHAIIVLGETTDVGEAVLLKPAFCLTHGEAVRAFRRGRGIGTGGGDSLIVVAGCRRGVVVAMFAFADRSESMNRKPLRDPSALRSCWLGTRI